jgi:hypothetical protein
VLFKCCPNFTISQITDRDVQEIEAANLNAEVRAEWDKFHSSYACGNFGASATSHPTAIHDWTNTPLQRETRQQVISCRSAAI